MQKRKDYPFSYPFLKAQIMSKKYSISFFTGGVKMDDWNELSNEKKKIALSKSWYVRWAYRNPLTGILERKNNLHGGVNYFKTKKERLKVLKYIKKHLKKALDKGYIPVSDKEVINIGTKKNEKEVSVKEAFDQALDLIVSAIKKAGFENGKDVSICLDVAANELFKNNKYSIHSKNYISVEKSIKEYQKIIKKYKIKSIEDPFAENDWLAWNRLMKSVKDVQIVGDDLYVTNLERLKKGFLNISSNSILIKLNQIGTVSETLDVIKFAQTIGYKTIISHRSGESEDTFIADLAVGTNSNQIKTGSLARSERVAKYNQLIRIEEELGNKARMNKIN